MTRLKRSRQRRYQTALRGGYAVYSRSFPQSIGAEVLTNGSFAAGAWTGDNPNGWTVGGESGGQEVTERDSGQAHADTKTTGGSANFFVNTATDLYVLQIPGLVPGNVYVFETDISRIAAGSMLLLNGSGNTLGQTFSITGINKTIDFAEFDALYLYASLSSVDMTFDFVSAKPVTLNPQQATLANARSGIEYILPATPRPHYAIELRYRIVDNANFWRARLARNDANTQWQITLDEFIAYTKVNKIPATNVGDTDAIRIDHKGDDHSLFTRSGGLWTQRGGTITDSSHNTATGLNVFYVPEFTPLLLSSEAI